MVGDPSGRAKSLCFRIDAGSHAQNSITLYLPPERSLSVLLRPRNFTGLSLEYILPANVL